MDMHAGLIKPRALQPGDTIGVVAPSWCGPATFPHRVQRGAQFLESLGYRVVLSPHAFGCQGYVSGTAEERASDIHRLFADPIVTDMDFGHTDPTLTLPIGCRAIIDVPKQQCSIVEAAVTGAG